VRGGVFLRVLDPAAQELDGARVGEGVGPAQCVEVEVAVVEGAVVRGIRGYVVRGVRLSLEPYRTLSLGGRD